MKSFLSKSLLGLVTLCAASSPTFASTKCIPVQAECIGCTVESFSVSGGSHNPSKIHNSAVSVCNEYDGSFGTYRYQIGTRKGICSGSFPISQNAEHITINVYADTCKAYLSVE